MQRAQGSLHKGLCITCANTSLHYMWSIQVQKTSSRPSAIWTHVSNCVQLGRIGQCQHGNVKTKTKDKMTMCDWKLAKVSTGNWLRCYSVVSPRNSLTIMLTISPKSLVLAQSCGSQVTRRHAPAWHAKVLPDLKTCASCGTS